MSSIKKSFFLLSLFALALLVPEAASAGGPLGETLCSVRDWFTGPVGGGIATLAIIIIGVGALLGKVSWGMAIIVGLGVATVFGSTELVGLLGGADEC